MPLPPTTRAVLGVSIILSLGVIRYLACNGEPAAQSQRPPISASALPEPVPLAARPLPARHPALETTDGGLALPASGHAGSEPLVEPHPPSVERLAMIPPWGTVDDVRAAHEARDFERARAILRQRKQADPRWEEWRDFYTGLELIGDCLETPGAATRSRAEAFIHEFRASPMRRHVRRACGVEGKPKGT